MSKIKVLIFAGKSESTTLMFNGIKDYFHIEKVIIEAPVSKKTLLKRRIKSIGLVTVIGQIIFMAYSKLWLKKRSIKRINEIKNDSNLNDENIDESIIEEVLEGDKLSVFDVGAAGNIERGLKRYRHLLNVIASEPRHDNSLNEGSEDFILIPKFTISIQFAIFIMTL